MLAIHRFATYVLEFRPFDNRAPFDDKVMLTLLRASRCFTFEPMDPLIFTKVIDDIKDAFPNRDAVLHATALADRGLPSHVVSAAIAALVHDGFLRWTHDGRLIRADAPDEQITRRTA